MSEALRVENTEGNTSENLIPTVREIGQMAKPIGEKFSKVFMGDIAQVIISWGSRVHLQRDCDVARVAGNLVPLGQQRMKQCHHLACEAAFY